MASAPQTDNFMMRRLVREAIATRPAAPRAAAAPELTAREQSAGLKMEDDVADSIRAIERVVENFGALKENFSFYKDLVVDLKGKLEDEQAQREDFHRELLNMERALKSERERAVRAEATAKASDTQARDLEHQLASLQSQTERLVKAISLLVSAEVDMRGDDLDGSLRLVS